MAHGGKLLEGKKIILGVTGGIAAYKAVLLLRLLVKEGAEVQVLLTEAAKAFVGPVTFAALSGRPALSTLYDMETGAWHNHVELGLWADAMVVAPATSATLAKAAQGQADSLLLATYLSARCPVLWAPAMDLDMYAHPAVQQNLALLRGFGNTVMEAAEGELASGLAGPGRLPEPEVLLEAIITLVVPSSSLRGKHVLITAGPTYEPLDPVRFIGNYSSGKQGYALARLAAHRGATVTLVSGPSKEQVHHTAINTLSVETAEQMLAACQAHADKADVLIFAAAVADYQAKEVAITKTKKTADTWDLHLVPTHDVALSMGLAKRPGAIHVGFALESGEGIAYARQKLERKLLDLVVYNSLDGHGERLMGAEHNQATLVTATSQTSLPRTSKTQTASLILDAIEKLL